MARNTHFITNIEHPLALGSFRNWLTLLRENGDIDAMFIPRILTVSLLALLTSPLRIYERLSYEEVLNRTAIHPSPIFIIGHWRTGTTHLQNLLCQNKDLSFVSTFQAMAPGFCLVGRGVVKRVLGRITEKVYPTRLIDNIPLSLDSPQEEEYAIANMSPYSFLHVFSFPRHAPQFFERYVLFNDLSEEILDKWRQVYLQVLRKASFISNGSRLVLKNPAHSGRLSIILELFPEAKFIHLYRNPYDLFLSTLWLYKIVLPRSQVQQIDWEQVEEYILTFYAQLMRKFLADKSRIPPRNLVEVKFEDLEAAPLEQLRKIYQGLDLPGFTGAEPAMRSYLESVAGYRKNQYVLKDEIIEKVNQNWQFTFDEWGYERLSSD
jgi:hypothetical protein